MAAARVLRLDEYRDKRLNRLSLARALYKADPARHGLLTRLVEVAEVTAAERVAVVWIDEYGPGLVHPHVVLDLLSDRPRRNFSPEPLQKAWEYGIPGAYDRPGDAGESPCSTFAIALGSDGSRAWFLVADSISPRPMLGATMRDRVMFLAGECTAIALHRDIDAILEEQDTHFAGWDGLQDLEGRESDAAQSQCIVRRFVVARLVRMFVDEDLAIADHQRSEQAQRARAELAEEGDTPDDDAELLETVLRLYEGGELSEFGDAILSMGEGAERIDHYHGALESYRCAYDIAGAIGAPALAIEASRKSGRILRRRARWQEAEHWYGIAREISETAGLRDLTALALSGLALINKERGNLPEARAGFETALEVAAGSGDPDVVARVHHDLLGLEHAVGDLPAALGHGWLAVSTYTTEVGRTRCLVSLAGALKEYGDWQAAEDAYTVVTETSDEHYYLTYALDALAHLGAIQGDEATFEARAAECDALGWETGSLSAKAEILLYRAFSYQALGRLSEAREWLGRAVTFAEENAFNRVLFEAETALLDQSTRLAAERSHASAAPPEVRDGLRAMRAELTGAGAQAGSGRGV